MDKTRKRKGFGVPIWATAVLLGAIAYTEIAGSGNLQNRDREVKPGKRIEYPSIQESVFRDGPVYSNSEVPKNMCSRYVRFAAKDLFGLDYPAADAWNLRDSPGIDEIKIRDAVSIDGLVEKGTLKPGMILAVYNPTSAYNERARKSGAGYTHVMIYLGKDGKDHFFADKFGSKTRSKISLDEITKSGLQPREILYRNNSSN